MDSIVLPLLELIFVGGYMTSRWPEHSLAILCGTSGNGDARVDGYFFKASRTVTWLEPSPTNQNQEGFVGEEKNRYTLIQHVEESLFT